MSQIRKLLIANRGEIARRIIRTCRKLSIPTVAVFSKIDEHALFVQEADEAVLLGPAPASESYLRVDAIIRAARESGADAVHPGYGFLSEREVFAQAVLDAGLIWIGPRPAAIRALGDKITAKRLMEAAGVPTVPGFYDAERGDTNLATLREHAERIGFPLLIKASAGGGGKGMRLVEELEAFDAAVEGARREAQAAFGDPTVFLEKYIVRPRHIEFQIVGDNLGNVVHLGERECSVQRRHQKVLEESPSPAPQMTPELRARMGTAAVAAGKAADYNNAGTVEFILDENGNYYFLEMNTRLQVEHPVTEEVTRVPQSRHDTSEPLDLVELQIRVAEGEALPFTQDEVSHVGHAIEVRVYAEDAAKGFLPSIGRLTRFNAPEGAGIRNEIGVRAGDEVSVYYDPMLAKLICTGPDRETARLRLLSALSEYDLAGVTTNIGFLFWLANHPEYAAGHTDTGFIERYFNPAELEAEQPSPLAAIAAATYELLGSHGAADPFTSVSGLAARPYNPWLDPRFSLAGQGPHFAYSYQPPGTTDGGKEVRVRFYRAGRNWRAECDGVSAQVEADQEWWSGVRLKSNDSEMQFDVDSPADAPEVITVRDGSRAYWFRRPVPLSTDTLNVETHLAAENKLEAPMPGKIVQVLVSEGSEVAEGERLVVMEAMKMEFTIRAPHAGKVEKMLVVEGQLVQAGAALVELGE